MAANELKLPRHAIVRAIKAGTLVGRLASYSGAYGKRPWVIRYEDLEAYAKAQGLEFNPVTPPEYVS